jgi:hypothetical protein
VVLVQVMVEQIVSLVEAVVVLVKQDKTQQIKDQVVMVDMENNYLPHSKILQVQHL